MDDKRQVFLAERKRFTVEHNRQDVDGLDLCFVEHVHDVPRAPVCGVRREALLNVRASLRLQACRHELEMRLAEHFVLRTIEGARKAALELPVEHVHGLAHPQGAARFEELDRVGPAKACHLQVEHVQTECVAVPLATLHEEREHVSKELTDRTDERDGLHERRAGLLRGTMRLTRSGLVGGGGGHDVAGSGTGRH